MKLKKYSVLACGVLASAVLVACNGGAGTAGSPQTLTPMGTSNGSIKTLTAATGATENLYSIAKGNGVYVVVGDGGVILTSTDGKSWGAAVSGVSVNLHAVAYNIITNLFYAVGDNSIVLSSVNGTSWTQYKALIPQKDLYSIMSVNGHLIIGADNSTIFEIDTNVRSLVTARAVVDNIKLISGSYGNGMMVLGGDDGSVLYKAYKYVSDWNNDWNRAAKFSGMSINGLSYESSNDWFLAGTSTGKVIQSENGKVWSTPVSASALSINSIVLDNKSHDFFAVGGNDGVSSMMVGLDYDRWSPQTLPVTNVQFNDVKCFDNNDCFIIGDSGTILYGLQRDTDSLPVWTAASSS